MSVDPAASKKAWASVLSIRNTPLLSDFWPHGKVARDYDLFLENMGVSGRFNILVDEQGNVLWAKEYALGELPDLEEVLKAIARA